MYLSSLHNTETNPELAAWGDALFYSAVNNLYRAAQLDAVATVAESWGEVAIGLALYISPLVSLKVADWLRFWVANDRQSCP